ncbi:cell cycle checkpoint control protein RAD9A [Nasonia vitripennis]|uniref:Cell cycle checkpoint control protein n=1 Tax=Nasonia vitripennis TaxID=7425 RepID=A0A7M7T6X6_NASVI|nr:cell cycle checkpoint control protein RAD9A [Nasonia vitripennis]
MKCVIPGVSLKFIARAIHMFLKIGEELCLVPEEDRLSLRITNACNSAYAEVTFHEQFFTYYAYEDQDAIEDLKCKITIKSAMTVFKSPALLEKQVEACHVQISPNAEKVLFIMKFKNGIIKTHSLPVVDTGSVKAKYNKDGFANHLRIQPKVMNDVIQNFHINLVEITIEVLEDKALIRNYIDENSNICNETRTQLQFGVGEFDEYTVESDTVITFCLKEFRAIMGLTDAIAQPINIHFDRPGRPAIFICQNNDIETHLVLATLNPDCDTGSQSTTSTAATNLAPKKAPSKRATTRGRGAKSFSKKSFNSTNKTNRTNVNTSTNTPGIENADSPGRISDFGDSPSQNKRDSFDSSRTTITPKTSAQKGTTSGNSDKPNPFSSFLKRKSDQKISSPTRNNDDNEDLVQNSPPRHQSKRAKLIFQKCFQSTFDPRLLPGHNNVEVEDSGEESN